MVSRARIDAVEQHGAVAHQRQRGMQFMGAAAQGPQLLGRRGAVRRLAEALAAARQRLIGAQHQPAGNRARHRAGLGARQQTGDRRGVGHPGFGFDRAFVDPCRPDLEAQTDRREQFAAHVAFRREHQRLGGRARAAWKAP